MNKLARTMYALCVLASLSACGEAMAYRQNPTAHPDYLNRVFADMNRCIERKGWKQVGAQPQQVREPARSEFAQTERLARQADEHHRN